MGFKIDDDSFIDRRKLQTSGGRKHPTWKLASDVISSEICLSYHQCLPVFIQHRDLLLCDRLCGSVGGGRCGCSIALHASRRLGTGGSSVIDDEGGLVSFSSHDGIRAGAVQQAVIEKQNA
jgi:hypothetical protein